jgi:HAD superfamily hydrolase (TIGR01490 family)
VLPEASPATQRSSTTLYFMAETAGWAAAELEAALVVPPKVDSAAFFDVDNTMMRGASIYYFARGLAKRRYFTTGDLARMAWKQVRFRVLANERSGDITSAREAALAFIAGWKVEDIARLSEDIFDELMADKIWSGTRALADLHLAAGERVWLVTAAPVELGTVIASRLGLTGALGTVAQVRDGHYTGKLVGDILHGPAKAVAIKAIAAAEGLDLSKCTAYSDSINDIPMLSAVGNAVAVNPDSTLRRAAKLSGWEIRDFRTGRKAAKAAVPVAVGAGIVTGAVLGAVAISRRKRIP